LRPRSRWKYRTGQEPRNKNKRLNNTTGKILPELKQAGVSAQPELHLGNNRNALRTQLGTDALPDFGKTITVGQFFAVDLLVLHL
jgi:hypothetical protein